MYKNAKMVGSGERTLVLAHGYGGSQAAWDKVVPYLAQRNRVLLFDWDFSGGGGGGGDGEAEAEQYYSFGRFADGLVALMGEMEVSGGAVYVGHSMSGMVGCIAAVKRPDLFAHLVLLCASPRYLNSDDYEGGFERAEVESMLAGISASFHSWAKAFVPLAVGVDDADLVALLGESFLAMDPKVAHDLASMIFLGDQRGVLGKLDVPCTIIQAASDFAVPRSVGRYMQGKMRRCASVETVDAVGHFPQLVAPKKVLDVLDGVLQSGSSGDAEQRDGVQFAEQREIGSGGAGDIDIAT